MIPRYGEKMIHTVWEEKGKMSFFEKSLPVILNSYFVIFTYFVMYVKDVFCYS